MLSETHITKDVKDHESQIKGYKVYHCYSHSRHTGGVCIYIKNTVKLLNQSNDSIDDSIWACSIEFLCAKKKIKVTVIYKSPMCNNLLFIDYITELLKNKENYVNNYVCGDFNINMMANDNISNKLRQCINDNCMKQLLKEPTNTSKTLLDLVISDDYCTQTRLVNEDNITDHSTIQIFINNTVKQSEVKKSFSNVIYTINELNEYLWCVNWQDYFMASVNIHQKSDILTNVMSECARHFTKIKSIKEECNNKDWYTIELRELKKQRDNVYKKFIVTGSNIDWIEYKKVKNMYASKVNKTKESFIKGKLLAQKNNQKGMWKILKEIIKGKIFSSYDYIDFEGNKVDNSAQIVDCFNKYFVNSVMDINKNIKVYDNVNEFNVNINARFKFKCITEEDLKKDLQVMKNKKDSENMNIKIWLDAFPAIGYVLTDVVNISLQNGEFPKNWKLSTISPIQKVNGSMKSKDFRPVNSMPVYEKILEYQVKNQLLKYINENDILIKEQSGYRQDHSCETALNYLIADWKMLLDENKNVVCVFIDFQRAFETIDRDKLLRKLMAYGIVDKEIEWFRSYLSDRKQRVKFQNTMSEEVSVNLGVPQGSILGALLFILYINNISAIFKYCKIKLFADDTLLYVDETNVDVAINKINEDLSVLFQWLCVNKLKLNVVKTKYMILSNREQLSDMKVIIDGANIVRVSEIVYLGIVIDDKLKFNNNMDYVCKKLGKKINFFSRISRKLDLESRITVYNTIVSPHFKYCSTIMFLSNETGLKRLQVFQNKAMRIILKCNRQSKEKEMLNSLKWLGVKDSICVDVLKFMFKIKNNLLPKYLDECFISNESNYYRTRSFGDFKIPRVKRSSTQNSLIYNGAKLFNELPNEIKNEKNFNVFKRKLIVYKSQ